MGLLEEQLEGFLDPGAHLTVGEESSAFDEQKGVEGILVSQILVRQKLINVLKRDF